jgi:hypothetical protein
MRLDWIFLKYRHRAQYLNAELSFAEGHTLRFVHGNMNTFDDPAQIVVHFGGPDLTEESAMGRFVCVSYMNGLSSHVRHCSDPVLYVRHNDRYQRSGRACSKHAVPLGLRGGQTLAIRNMSLSAPTLYLHVAMPTPATGDASELDFALQWLRSMLPTLQYLSAPGGGEPHNDAHVQIRVCHDAAPPAVIESLCRTCSTAVPTTSAVAVPFWDVRQAGAWDGRQAGARRQRIYVSDTLTPWDRHEWWRES